MKYCIGVNAVGHPIVVVFDESFTHLHVAALFRISFNCLPTSAGFVYKDGIGNNDAWKVSDRVSESLGGMGPAKDDQAIINAFLDKGLSGLDLINWLAYQQIQKVKKRKVK